MKKIKTILADKPSEALSIRPNTTLVVRNNTRHNSNEIRERILKKHKYTDLFKSRKHEIAFYFILNNPEYDLELEILPLHKIDKAKALQLKNEYKKIFHPDKNIYSNNEETDDPLDYNEITKNIDKTFARVTGALK